MKSESNGMHSLFQGFTIIRHPLISTPPRSPAFQQVGEFQFRSGRPTFRIREITAADHRLNSKPWPIISIQILFGKTALLHFSNNGILQS
ncbi:MAG TPA: hypothetical protein VIS74_04585 [Chthoniobacterales bacterium]